MSPLPTDDDLQGNDHLSSIDKSSLPPYQSRCISRMGLGWRFACLVRGLHLGWGTLTNKAEVCWIGNVDGGPLDLGVSTNLSITSRPSSNIRIITNCPLPGAKIHSLATRDSAVLGLRSGLHPEGPYANAGFLGAYDPKYTESRMTRPLDVG